MGKDVKKRFTVSLDIETKDVEKQVKATVGNLKTILADLGKASDKMGYFKELVDYIGQIDTALTALRAKNKNAFDHMFDGLDADLKKAMEGIFGTSGTDLSKLDVLREKLSTLTPKSKISELKEFAKEINELFTSVGLGEQLNMDDFKGKATQDHIDQLTRAVANFATVWDGVNKRVSGGFGFGDGDGPGSIVELSEEVQKEIDKLKAQIDEFEKLKTELLKASKTLSAVKQKGNSAIPDSVDAHTTIDAIHNLVSEFDNLESELQSGDKTSVEYCNRLVRMSEIVLTLKKSLTAIRADKSLSDLFQNTPSGQGDSMTGMLSRYVNNKSSKYTDEIIGPDLRSGISEQIKNLQNQILYLEKPFDVLNEKVQKYLSLEDKMGKTKDQDKWNALSEQKDQIVEYIVSLDKVGDKAQEIEQIFENLSFGDIELNDGLHQLCELLGVQIPSAIKTAKDSINGAKKTIPGSNEGAPGDGTGSGSGVGGTITNVDFTSLENTIKAEISSLANKLDSVFKVEVVKNDTEDIKNAIDGVKSTIEKISAEIDSYNTLKKTDAHQAEVNAMKNNLTQLLKFVSEFNNKQLNGQYQDQEISAAILSDGSITTGYGEDGTVPWDRMASALVSNLTKSLMVDIHSHPWAQNGYLDRYANDSFSGSKGDLGAFRFSKELGAQMAAMITGNVMRTLDISKLTDEQMMQFRKALTQIEKTKANTPEYSKYMEYKNDKLYYHSQPTLDEQHKVTEAFESLMYEAFKQIGLSKNKVDKEIFKKYDLTDNAQLTELAERLVLLSQSSQNALSPVERLSEIISHFSGDVNSKTAKENFEAFTKGELTAAEVFNNLNRDGHTLNQATLDSLYKIDSANEMPVIESLLTQVVSALNAIESSVVNINNNTRQSTRDQFDTAINDILDIREGVNNKNILAGIKSIFDPLNISEYKNNEVLQIADGSILDAKDYIQDLFVKSHSEGSVSLDEMQIALDKFYLAMSNIQDAIKQVDLYEERTGKTHIDNAGEIAKYTLNDKYKEITDDNLLQQLLYLLSQAKVDISKSKEFYQGGFGDKQTDYDDDQVASILQSVKSILDSIYGVLHGFTGIEADNKNALKYKEPAVDTGINRKEFSEQDLSVLNSILQVLQSIDINLSTNKSDDVSEKVAKDNTDISDLVSFIKSKLSHQIATEDTLQAIKGAIEQVAELVKPKDENKTDDSEDITQNLNTLISALTANVTTLKDVANGIVKHQKAQKSDTSKAMARIQDPTEQQIISGIAKNSVIDLGTEVEIESLQALANGLVKVEGAFKNANGQWEGFAVKVNEANAAVDLAIKKQSAFAKALNKAKDIDENTYQYNKEEVEARAKKHLEEYAAQGKNATVQFKDSGRYTITILEEIDGLSKQIFQTFDENDDKIERTTVTMSNSQKLKLENLQKKLIDNGLTNGLISDKDSAYSDYQNAADALVNMTDAYSKLDSISDVEIANWKQQIALVQQLGAQVEALINQRKSAKSQKVFESEITKSLGKFNREKVELEGDIDMTKISDKLKSEITDARTAIANATDADSLKIAINNWDALKNNIKAAATEQDLFIKKEKKVAGGNTKKGQAYGTSQLQNFTARYNSLMSGASDVGLNEQSTVVANLANAYKQLQTAQSAFIAGEDKTTTEYAKKVEVFKAAQLACNNYARELNRVVTSSKKLAAESDGFGQALNEDFEDNFKGREEALRDFVQTTYGSKAAIGEFDQSFNKLNFTVKNGDGTFTKMTASINEARTAIYATAGATGEMTGKFGSFINELKGKLKSISTYFMASFGIEEVWQQLRQGIQYVREIDSALTELKKVTNETDASYDAFLQSMSKTGSVIGATVQDLTTMAADWARLGYSMEEAGKLAESTAILLNVSEFQDANAASEALISTMQAFQYTADESGHVVDILNEVGNNYAVSSDGLAIALQDSASALMTAGASLEESVALIAAANKVVQDPNSVGGALRTISLRLRGTSLEVLEQMGEETEGVIESTSKLQEKIKSLSGVDILSASGDYRSPYEILKDIAAVYEDMESLDQAALIEMIAGKNRANTLAAILTNFEDLEGAYESALDAEGSAMRENERYLESVQGHIDTFNNSLQTMWMNFLNTDAVKWFIHLGDEIIKLIDNVGVLQTILTSIGGIWFSKNFGGSLFGGQETTKNNIEQLKEAAKAAENIWVNDPTTKNKKAFDEAKENLEAYEAKLKEVNVTTEVVGDTTQSSGNKMSVAFSKVGKQLTQLAKSMAIMYAVSTVFELLGKGISYVTETFKDSGNSVEALNNKYEEVNNQLSDCESELRSLESEFKTIDSQIKALEAQGTLTYAEQEELERLQGISAELERQIALKETLGVSLQKGVNDKALNAADAYLNTSFDSDKSKTDRQEEAEENGKTIGQVAGNVIGAVAAPLLAKLGGKLAATASAGIISKLGGTLGSFFGGPVGTLVGMGIGAAAGELLGGWIGSASEGAEYDQEQTVSDAIENMKEERSRLEKAANDAYDAYIASPDDKDKADAYTSAAQALSLYDEKMAEHIGTLSQYYNSVDWESATDLQKEETRKIGNMIDKYAIEMNASGAKSTALDRIFGENASEEIQSIKEQILEAAKSGEDFNFEDAINGSQQLKNSLDYVGISAEDVKNYFTQIGEAAKNAVANDINPVETYSSLVGDVEAYNAVLEQTSEIVSDNTEVTQEYKDSLKSLGLSEEELADCFDENNKLIVKNAALLNKLVKQKKQDKTATVQQAKAYGQLQYKTTINQIGQLVNRMATEIKATGYVSAATLDNISVLREQLDVIKQTIQQYALLELSLSDAAQAYSDFEAAKQRDAQLTYGDSLVDALSVLNEGFKTGQVGSEAFQYAVKLIVPPEVYENIDNVQARMQAIHDYVDKNPIFADYFTIDEGQISITMDNIKAFLQDGLDDGLGANFGTFIGTIEDFDLAPHIQSVKDLADAYGITESAALAMLTEFEKYDASWGNIISRLTTTELDRNIEDTTTALEEAIAAQEEFIKSGQPLYDENGEITSGYKAVVDAVNKARDGLDNATQAAINNAQTYTQVESILKGMSGEMKYTQEQADALARSLGLIDENGHITINTETGALELTSDQVDILNQKLTGLEEPTVLDIQLASDQIDQQIQELQKKLKGEAYDEKVLVGIEAEGEEEIQAKIDELTATQEVIKLVYDITPSGEQNDSNLEKLGNWEANGVNITVRADITEAKADIEEINATETTAKEVPITTTANEANAEIDSVDNNNIADKKPVVAIQGVSAALTNIYSIDSALDELPNYKPVTVDVIYKKTGSPPSGGVGVDGNFHVSSDAFAGGTVGAPRNETALMGELGPEILVRDGRWTTVGENGAEFTQVKKGDIIFNHKQSEQLLKNGCVTGRGKAYAGGTAYGFGIFDSYVGDNDAFKNGSSNWVNPGENAWSDAADDISDSVDDVADDAEQVVDFIEMKLEEIEAIIEKTSTRIANFLDDTTSIKSKDELYDELVKAEKDKSEAYLKAAQKYNVEAAAALSGVPQQYQEMARNGAIAIEDFIGEDQVEIAEKIEEYRDWASKADEAENGHLEAIAAISAHRVEQLEDIATDFENIIRISKSHSDLIQAEMDFIEESGGRLSEGYYEELKKHSQKQLNDMQDERVALQKILDDSVAAGDVIIGSDDWYSMLETIYEVDQEIIDCKTSLEEFQNAINELYWDNFDKLIEEIDNVDSELSNLYDLISDDDKIVDEMGNWTDDGITALGLLAQQMENAQFKSQEYGDAIDKLKKDYANGLYSTDEYNEKLSDLTDSQYNAIKSYEDAKDAIVDLNKTRAEAVKKYMQEEIDKYGELIEKKKESLNADKEARDFEKSVQESNKNIKDIERQIAALQGNTSSSAMAQRKRLEAELLKAREELDDLYYDHSVEKQQEALDKELEDYTKNKEDQMDTLDKYLEKEDQVIADSFDLIADNTKSIVDTLISVSEEYGVTISDTITTPWISGANAIGTYQEQLNTSVSATTANLETLKQHLESLQTQADKTAASIVAATHSTVIGTNDGHQTSIKGYAKGSNGVEYDQWAILDELGEELQLVPNKAGRLDYIKKGTAILNNTLTDRLIDLAMDPTSMLENNRPVIGTPGITTTNNTFAIDASVGTLLHVEHIDGSNPADVAKLVDKAWEKKMQTLNNSIKKFTR